MTATNNEVSVPPASARTEGAAVLVLEDGARFEGRAYGATGQALGAMAYTSAIVGYQEILTDAANADKIVLFAAPHAGITGANSEDAQAETILASGLIVRDPSRRASNYRATRTLDEELVNNGTVGIAGVDTRALSRLVQGGKEIRCGIFSGASLELSNDEQLALVTGATTGEAN
ncbi:hypothetical protein ICM05_09295 [Leucobacter sp. cx-42]|uniref:carbamoyl-phosphate synthase domain-containing protein n=1 Tax=unclassified Leucobacter TaxID=2621730 RepID=UPI00165E8740|nr:hypothetical protein [Leucobacter sp. cx-42]